MKVFVSWSGNLSREVASILRTYLPCIIQELDVFMSKHDIESGARWSFQLASELEESSFGIVCLTPDNLQSAWLLFEAGALTKHLEGRACCLLLNGLMPTDVSGPLSQFQNRLLEVNDFRALIKDINQKLPTPLGEGQLEIIFQKWWPDIEQAYQEAVQKCGSDAEQGHKREPRDILEELLTRVRSIERSLLPPESIRSPSSEVINLVLDRIFEVLSDNQRKLLRKLVTPKGTIPVLSSQEVNSEQDESDLRVLERMAIVHRTASGYELAHKLLAEYLAQKLFTGDYSQG